MPGYLPFAGRHAIAEMSISLQFATPFEPSIGAAIEEIKAEFAADFPKFEPAHKFAMNIGFAQPMIVPPQPTSTIAGFTLTRLKADQTPARVLRALSQLVSVHFLEYSDWSSVKPEAVGYFTRCLDKMGIMSENPATGVLVRFVDRFPFDGDPKNASGNLLFRPDSKFVAAKVLNSGGLWHCFSGWYELTTSDAPALNQLNISSNEQQGIAIDHNMAVTFARNRNSMKDLVENVTGSSLNTVLDRQHDTNVKLLRDLLNNDMLSTIGLKVRERS